MVSKKEGMIMSNSTFSKKKATTVGVVMVVLIVLCVMSNVYLLTNPSTARTVARVGTVLNLIALAFASAYCISGYRKDDSIMYRGFLLFYALHLLTGTYGMVVDFKGSVMAAAWVLAFEITFANMLMLCVPDDLGKKKSTVIAAENGLIWLGFLIHHFLFKSHTIGIYTIRIVSYLLSAVILSILIYARYTRTDDIRK